MKNIELIKKLQRLDPNLPVIFVDSDNEEVTVESATTIYLYQDENEHKAYAIELTGRE